MKTFVFFTLRVTDEDVTGGIPCLLVNQDSYKNELLAKEVKFAMLTFVMKGHIFPLNKK